MKVVVVSDVHGNLVALDAVAAAVEREAAGLVVHGGDLAFNGPQPAGVVDRIRELGWPCIIGNTDALLAENGVPERAGPAMRALVAATAELLGPERSAWLQTLPPEWRLDGLLLVHASPGSLWVAAQPDASDDELRTMYGGHGASLVVYCHIHTPFVRELDGLTVANSGSVGWPTDGDRRPSYLVIEDGSAAVRRVDYDVEREIAVLRGSSYPSREWLEQVHRTGRIARPVVEPGS